MYIEILKSGLYGVKILKCKSFLIALRRNSKKCTFLLCKIFKSWSFLTALRRNSKKWIFLSRKNYYNPPFVKSWLHLCNPH